MSDQPAGAAAGWYPDPWGRHQFRLWDGRTWTSNVRDGGYESVDAPSAPSGPLVSGVGSLGSIGSRFVGALIDSLILLPLAIASLFSRRQIITETDSSTGITRFQFVTHHASPAVVVALFLPGALYTVGLIASQGRTVGERVVHLRVARRVDGAIPGWAVAFRRWMLAGAVALLRFVPVLGAVGGLVLFLDYLWALWDPNRQTLHDKIADTVVVRTD